MNKAVASGACRRKSRVGPLTPRIAQVILLLAMFGLWEGLPSAGLVPTLFLPPLSATLVAVYASAKEYVSHTVSSFLAIGISMLFACGLGIGGGLTLGNTTVARRKIMRIASGLYAIPLVVLYPLFTAWFGIGPQSKIVFASVYGFLPCFLGTMAGIQTIDPQYVTVARSLKASTTQMLFHVLVPAAIPTVLSSLRVGGSLVIVGVVVAEMLSSNEGIGYLIARYRTLLDSPKVFGGIVLVVVIVLAFGALVSVAERATQHWRPSSRSARGG